jgi:hypothetical protein
MAPDTLVHRSPAAALLALLTLGLVAAMLLRAPEARGDSGEYLLTVEALANHGTPDVRAGDVQSLAALAAKPGAVRGNFGRLWHALREAPSGRWYTYHFWLYPAAVVPARVALDTAGLNPLAAAQLTNALLLSTAAWLVLLAPWLDRRVAACWSLLTVIGPAAWFCAWPHPEVFSFSLVTAALVLAAGRRLAGAALVTAIAATQNPPLAPLALLLALAAGVRGEGSVLRRASRAAAATAPAALPAVFYLLTFGRPSLMVGESATWHAASIGKAASLLFDLNTGLLPYVPGAVVLALAALVVKPPGAFPPAALCLAGFAIGALGASTGIQWNFGTSGPSRYAVWLSPFVLLPAAQWAARRGGTAVLTLAVALQAAVVLARLPRWAESDEHRHSYAAEFVLRRWPALYSPHPDIFRGRTASLAGDGPYVFRAGGRCTKALARKRHAAVLEAACGPLPEDFSAWMAEIARAGRGRGEWRYVDYGGGGRDVRGR